MARVAVEEGQLLLHHEHHGVGLQRFFSQHAAAIYSALLMALIAVERLTFKLMVDRMAPFRFVLAQAVAVCYALAVGFVVFRRSKSWRGGDRFEDGRGDASGSDIREGDGNVGRPAGIAGFPVWRLAMMAILDMLHLVPMIVAAADVAPTLTVLLLQCSAPFCLAVAALFCRRRYPDKSVIGAVVIFLGACVAMFLPIFHLYQAKVGQRAVQSERSPGGDAYDGHDHGILRGGSGEYAVIEGYNTLVYMLACVPAAISTVFKQYALEQHGRPVDAHQLSLGVTAFEVVFIAIAAPFAYRLQGLGRLGEGSQDVLGALRDGWRCLLFMQGVEDVEGYPADAECWGGLPLVFLYVVSTLVVNWLVQKVVDSAESPAAYHRAMALSVPAAFVVLGLYDEGWMHDSLNTFTVIGLAVIMTGLFLYHSVAPPEDPRDSFDPASPPGKRYG